MNIRTSFHIYKIIEDYSKEYVSFEYSPKFKLPNTYYLTYKDLDKILKDNAKLVQALYDRDEECVYEILCEEDFSIDEFDVAQIDGEETDKQKSDNRTPLPIQARYVLRAWNMLRLNASKEEKEYLMNTLNKKAFTKSFFPQLSKMCLAFENELFNKFAVETALSIYTKDQAFLYYKLLAYYFRINNNHDLKELSLSLSKAYIDDLKIDESIVDKILNSFK